MPTEETPIVSLAQFADAFDISYDDADPVAKRAVTLEQARRYVNSLNQTSDNFPQDFTKLEYIESNGSQALDTGYNPNSNTRVVLDYNLTQLTGKWMGIFAARDLNGYANQYAYWSNETGVYRSNYSGETGILFGSQNTNRHIIDKNKAILKEDGIVVASHPAATFSCGCSLHIFCGNTGGTKEHYAYMKLYSCKIYNDDVLVRDYVPVKRNRDSLTGLYDRVSRIFTSSSGTGDFIPGPSKTVSYVDGNRILTLNQLRKINEIFGRKYYKLEYIKFDGDTLINTGYYANNKTRIVADISLDQQQVNSSWAFVYSSRTNVNVASYSLLRSGTTAFRYDFGSSKVTVNLSPVGRFTIDSNKNVLKINSKTSTAPSQTFTATHELKIGSAYTTGGSSDSSNNDGRRMIGNVYYFKIYDDDVLVRDYVPVKRISDGAIGLYDKVNKLFYGNDGTGTFGAGPEVGYI